LRERVCVSGVGGKGRVGPRMIILSLWCQGSQVMESSGEVGLPKKSLAIDGMTLKLSRALVEPSYRLNRAP
jgi:hypothetical protein